jgi:hypothetical protein
LTLRWAGPSRKTPLWLQTGRKGVRASEQGADGGMDRQASS